MPTALAPSPITTPVDLAESGHATRSFVSAAAARSHVKDLVRSVGWDPLAIAIDQLFGELLEHGTGNALVIDPGPDLASTVARFRWVNRR